MILKILGLVIFFAGAAMAFGAGVIVDKFHLNEKVKIDFENEMDEEEILKYKRNKAIVNFKMLGMIVSIPGIIMILRFF